MSIARLPVSVTSHESVTVAVTGRGRDRRPLSRAWGAIITDHIVTVRVAVALALTLTVTALSQPGRRGGRHGGPGGPGPS